MEPTKHIIETVGQLADLVTLENFEELASDMKEFLFHVAAAKALLGVNEVNLKTLTWTQDGKSEIYTIAQSESQAGTDDGLHISSKPTAKAWKGH